MVTYRFAFQVLIILYSEICGMLAMYPSPSSSHAQLPLAGSSMASTLSSPFSAYSWSDNFDTKSSLGSESISYTDDVGKWIRNKKGHPKIVPDPRRLTKSKLSNYIDQHQQLNNNHFPNDPLFRVPNKKKALLFDLDKTLVHTFKKPPKQTYGTPLKTITFESSTSSVHKSTRYVFVRPGLENMLNSLNGSYVLGVWSTAAKAYVDALLNLIDPHAQYFARERVLTRDNSGEKIHLKNLFLLGVDMKKVAIIDDNRKVSSLQMVPFGVVRDDRAGGEYSQVDLICTNCFTIKPFTFKAYGKNRDRPRLILKENQQILDFFEELASTEDVRRKLVIREFEVHLKSKEMQQ